MIEPAVSADRSDAGEFKAERLKEVNPGWLLGRRSPVDEPSLGLSPLLTSELFRALPRIAATGISVLLVEQNTRQSLAIADRAYLLEKGVVTGEGDARTLLSSEGVQKAYLGM